MTNFPAASEVEFLKANINYTEIFRVDGKKILIGYTLKKVIEIRYQNFVRINRSIAVNPAMISDRAGNQIKLTNQTFTISRRRL